MTKSTDCSISVWGECSTLALNKKEKMAMKHFQSFLEERQIWQEKNQMGE